MLEFSNLLYPCTKLTLLGSVWKDPKGLTFLVEDEEAYGERGHELLRHSLRQKFSVLQL